jgi:hypothetical protein
MFTSQIFGWKAMMLKSWKANTLSPNLPSSFLASKLYSLLVLLKQLFKGFFVDNGYTQFLSPGKF